MEYALTKAMVDDLAAKDKTTWGKNTFPAVGANFYRSKD